MYTPVKDGIEKTMQSVEYTEAEPPRDLLGLVHCFWELKTTAPLASDFQANENFNGMMIETSTAPDTRYETGDGDWYRFPIPQMVDRKSTIRVRLRDRSGQSNTIQIALDGIRVFG